MEWDPAPFMATRGDKRVSREKYNSFCELLGKRSGVDAELLAFGSRSGRRRLRIVGFDSNRVEGPEARGIGYVSREALQEGQRCLEQDVIDQFEQVFTWMAVHHHIFPATSLALEDAQQRRASVMGNASALLHFASHYKVDMILHGHEHHPSVTVARRWPTEGSIEFHPIAGVGAGSFGLDVQYLREYPQNQYYVLCRMRDRIIIRSRALGPSGIKFVSHQDIQLDRPFRAIGTGS